MTERQKAEFEEAEKTLCRIVFESNEIPNRIEKILVCMGINLSDWISSIESMLSVYMTESGLVDGRLLRVALKLWKPYILEYADIPNGKFRLSDYVETQLKIFFPGIKK